MVSKGMYNYVINSFFDFMLLMSSFIDSMLR